MAHSLDDPGFVTRLDPKGMYRLTLGFPDQCRRALEISLAAPLRELEARPGLVVLTGLGGSAAGGDLVRAIFDSQGTTPFIVNRDYSLPNYVGLGDLVFCASYSGNTEETLSAYDGARGLGARIVVVASGGTLAANANKDGYSLIEIPGGQPPRTALGFMMMPVLVACERLGLLPKQDYDAAFALLDECAKDWSVEVPFEKNEAKKLAAELHGKLAVLYGLGSWQGLVANRWKGQINENAKNMAFAAAFPELNHNEILGWVKSNEQGVAGWAAVILEDGDETLQMKRRSLVTERLVGGLARFHRIQARGDDLLQRILSLAYLGDFVSLYLAALNGVDPENIDSINVLKSELAALKN